MGYQIRDCSEDCRLCLETRDIKSGMVRLMWRHPTPAGQLADDPIARALIAEEALHGLFKRLFLPAAGQRSCWRGPASQLTETGGGPFQDPRP